MSSKTPKRWIKNLIAQSNQPGVALPWNRATKRVRRKAVVLAARELALT